MESSKNAKSTLFCSIPLFLLLLFFLFPSSQATTPSSTPIDSICDSTLNPSFCKSNLPRDNPRTIQDYTKISLNQSLSMSRNLLSLVQNYLKRPSTPSIAATRALEDCRLLASTNLDLLSNTISRITTNSNPDIFQQDDGLTWLSAVMTNFQSCLDSLEIAATSAQEIKNGFIPYLSNGTMSGSTSLALFKNGWVPEKPGNRRLYEYGMGMRRLLQSGGGGVNVSQEVVVNPDGSGNFTTINAAVAAAPTTSSGQYFVIRVVSGVYEEYVSIPSNKKYLMMIGDGINRTVITGNHSVGDNYTTFNSATFAVSAQNFVAINITFRNTAGAAKGQAVALRSGADLSTFYQCSFEGYQDTLYTHSLRQFYRECDIYGTVDFIFGNAAVVLQKCNIYPRLPLTGQFNAITAQGRADLNQNTGTSIHNCIIIPANDLATSNGTTKTYLGRPWKQYSRTVYMQSYMDQFINPAGWEKWSGDFLTTLYYAEFSNLGNGSDTSNRVTWPGYHVINETDAVNFTVSSFLLGQYWLPAQGVPFDAGLL